MINGDAKTEQYKSLEESKHCYMKCADGVSKNRNIMATFVFLWGVDTFFQKFHFMYCRSRFSSNACVRVHKISKIFFEPNNLKP